MSLVPVNGCPRCGEAFVQEVWSQPALFKHGGYGATEKHTMDICVSCFFIIEREVTSINPRR